MHDLLNKMIFRNLRIFRNDKTIFFKIDEDLYKIVFNKTLISTKFYQNEKIIDIDYDSKIDIYSFLYSFDKKTMKKIFDIPEKNYISKIKNISNVSIKDFLLKKFNKVFNKPFFSYSKILDSKFAIYHGIDFNQEKKLKVLKQIEKKVLNKNQTLELININILIDLIKQIIICKDITLYKHTLLFKINNNIIKFNLNDLYNIDFNNKIYQLNFEYIRYILYIIRVKDNSNKEINYIYKFKNIGKVDILNLDNSFSLYDLNLFKTKIKIKKNSNNSNSLDNSTVVKSSKPKVNIKNNDFLFDTKNFGTIGELLGKEKISIQDEIEVKNNSLKPYFKNKLINNKTKNNKDNIFTSLVLWDLENIHYFDDFSKISRFVKNENQIKVISFNSKYRNYEYVNKLNFLLNKLKKREWIIKETKNIADEELKKQFHNYKHNLKELIIVSNDSDFKDILEEANSLNIKTIVLHRNGRIRQFHWYEKAIEYFDLKQIN